MAESVLGWRDVRLGLAVMATLTFMLFAFWLERGRNPFAEAYVLQLYLENARGLEEGAPVTLSGVRVGDVRNIDVLAAAPRGGAGDTHRPRRANIRVVLEVDRRYAREITDRSQARISTVGVSGSRYVRIEKGPVGGDPLESGDVLRAAPSLDVEYLLEKGTELLAGFEALDRDASRVRALVEQGTGTLGRFLEDPSDNEVAENFEELNLRAARVMRSFDRGEGTLALERRTKRIRKNLTSLRASMRGIARGAAPAGGSLGLLAGDPELPRALGALDSQLEQLQLRLDRGDGSLGRFLNDPELFDQLDKLTLALDSLVTGVAEDPLGSVDIHLH